MLKPPDSAVMKAVSWLRLFTLGAMATLPWHPGPALFAQNTVKPTLHGSHWVAITGKPLAATAGAAAFLKGGNAVDAACAMLGATATMWDSLSWGGETQALIYNPNTKSVIGVNALGVAPSGATPEFFKSLGMDFPQEYGPLAALTPGTPGGLLVMLAEYGRLSLAEVLEPCIQMARDGYAIEADAANTIEKSKELIKQWPDSERVLLPHAGQEREGPAPGELFRQPDLAATLQKLVEAEAHALSLGKTRREAILAAFDRFYKGDIALEFVRGSREEGGLHTLEDLATWNVEMERPVSVSYKGIDVFKLTTWTQGPVLLQTLNLLEPIDLKSMGYNSTRYIHTLYQAMNLAYADRDFYYGDPYFPPEEPITGLLSKDYADSRRKLIHPTRNQPDIQPGDPYPFEGRSNPFLRQLENWSRPARPILRRRSAQARPFIEGFLAGTTSIQAADQSGWVVSITPSGGWIPAFIPGRTGIGMSQRMQSFVLNEGDNPFNVLAPGKRPRVTLTPAMALKGGQPFLSFAVQGGDTQDQNLLQFFLNVVEFGMTVQEAAEAANIASYQMRSSFDAHESRPGRLTLHESVPPWVRNELRQMGYRLDFDLHTSGPINAIWFDHVHGTLWGGSSDHSDDYGIAW
jgi:gamma-glutamyltranspeptidase / glutathione hydrolase